MTSWTSPFQEWINQEMVGMAASPEIMLLLAKAFDGGKQYEREACAKVCDDYDMDHIVGQQLAEVIRARGDK